MTTRVKAKSPKAKTSYTKLREERDSLKIKVTELEASIEIFKRMAMRYKERCKK